jgi:hypothetical protein
MDHLPRNTMLFTRDGRKIGNALVYGSTITAKGVTFYIVTDDRTIYLYTIPQLEPLFYMKDIKPADRTHINYDFTGQL